MRIFSLRRVEHPGWRLPGDRGTHRLRHRHGAGQAILVKTVTQMRAAEPGGGMALQHRDTVLGGDGGFIEDRMVELGTVEYQMRNNLAFWIEADEKRCAVVDALQQ